MGEDAARDSAPTTLTQIDPLVLEGCAGGEEEGQEWRAGAERGGMAEVEGEGEALLSAGGAKEVLAAGARAVGLRERG